MTDIKNYLGGSPKTLDEINMSVVLDRIRRGDNVSRSSLSRELNLSFPSISRIVEALIDKNYVVEVGPGVSSGGKRPIILRFNNRHSYVIGIGVDVDYIEIMLADFSGNEVNTIYEKFADEKSPQEMIEIIVKYVTRVTKESNVDFSKVRAASLGLPAMQDTESGLIGLCPTIPNWEGINLRKILSEKLELDVLIDNVANLSVLGEEWKGVAKNYKNVILVGIGTGIGAGILLNGKLYKGAHGAAGEIGYLLIDRGIKLESTAPFGPFEYYASNIALKRLCARYGFDNGKSYEMLSENEDCKSSVLEIIHRLACGIANLIAVLNPELVVVRGELFYGDDYYFSYLKDRVKNLITFKVRLEKSYLREKDVTFGAVRCALNYLDQKIFSPFFY